MARSDPLDASTMDAPRRERRPQKVPTVRVVFRPEAGIVLDEPKRLVEGETLAGRTVGERGIALADDSLVSREHAAFRFAPAKGELTVEDLGSRNGVYVGGARVERATLADGDVVRMGASFMIVRWEDVNQIDVPNASLVGVSPSMRTLRVSIKRVASSDASVLVSGDSGSGKEVVARALHDTSRRSGAFVAVNCAAIPENLAESQLFGHVAGAFTGARADHPGFFRAASNGTLFLDEIGDMPSALQPKLLRALETKEVVPVGAVAPVPFAARVVAATNVRLPSAIEAGSFRGDLFARLAQVRLEIPPLRARREDILPLVASRLPNGSPPLSSDLVDALLGYDFPFNVRELFAIVTELCLWSSGQARLELGPVEARLGVLPESRRASMEPSFEDESEPEVEAGAPPSATELEALLAKHAGNVAAVARAVGRSRTQVYRWVAQMGLDPTRYRSESR